MIQTDAPETIPISYLNALEYCPRRFHYEFVQGDMVVNDFVRLYLYSETLRLSGFTDVIESQDGIFIPVEYKHGKQGRWFNDHIQLCAQALCLEERQPGKPPIPYGYIFYFGSRKRVQVHFTPELRAKVLAAIDFAFQIAALAAPPPPLEGKIAVRCRDCSLAPICLPDEVRLLMGGKEDSLANTLPD